jgi:Endosomal/lysosomal potassium channel TMEM175
MKLLDRFKQGHLHLTRIEAFSDAVFAIVVTLLVLELKVPILKDHASISELAHHLYELAPKFLSWLISFIIVCKFWLNHHHILGLASHANYGLVWLNSIFLMGQSFIPFPTALVGEYATNRLAARLDARQHIRGEKIDAMSGVGSPAISCQRAPSPFGAASSLGAASFCEPPWPVVCGGVVCDGVGAAAVVAGPSAPPEGSRWAVSP